jgi:hypothetical protein
MTIMWMLGLSKILVILMRDIDRIDVARDGLGRNELDVLEHGPVMGVTFKW